MRRRENLRANADDDVANHRPAGLFESVLDEEHLWTDLSENIHDTFFPSRLPNLELTSTPIPVPDRMAVRTNRWAVGTSTLVNGGALVILIFWGVGRMIHPLPNPVSGHPVRLRDYTLFAPSKAQMGGGGGGGGSNSLIDPIVGRTPSFEKTPLTPPQIPLLDSPKLALDPAISVPLDIRLPDNPSLPTIGAYHSTNVRLASSGRGNEAGIGSNSGGGDGPGDGSGWGPGSDRGVRGGAYMPGVGGVSIPIPIVSPEAEFSEEARRLKYQGVCAISIVVDAHGFPQNLRVVRALGMGLDEKALEAVRGYRFKPALKNGKPVPAIMTIEVNFRLY